MKQQIRKILCFLLAFQIFSITAFARPDWPADTGIQAEAGIVMDMDSGAILFGQNIHVPYAPASITKLLTALVVLENCDLDETVDFTTEAVNSVDPDSGNKLSIVAGDQLSVEDCLYSLLLVSANQSANALAIHTAGSLSGFVDMMNEKIKELGCTESHFANPSGLSNSDQYVTAYDMALISQAAYNNKELLKISSTITYKTAPTTNNPNGKTLQQEHRLVIAEDSSSEFYTPSAVAGKTGYTQAAGNTLVTFAEQDGRHLISVILKGQPRQYFLDTQALLDFGFRNFKNVVIADAEERYVTGNDTIDLNTGSFKASDLKIEPDQVITLPNDASFDDAEVSLDYLPDEFPSNATAVLKYTYNDRAIGKAFLLAKDGVKVNNGAEPETSEPEVESSTAVTEPETTAPDETKTDNQKTGLGQSLNLSSTQTILLIVAAIIGLLVLALILLILYRHHEEKVAMAKRRERRRQRLQEAGETDAFEKLMAERRKRDSRLREQQRNAIHETLEHTGEEINPDSDDEVTTTDPAENNSDDDF